MGTWYGYWYTSKECAACGHANRLHADGLGCHETGCACAKTPPYRMLTKD